MSTGTCDTDLDELARLADAATPGPWKWWTSNSVVRLSGADGKDGGVLSAVMLTNGPAILCSPANQAFIAAADPLVVGSLVERIQDLQRLLDGERLENSRLESELASLRPAEPADSPSGGYFMIPPKAHSWDGSGERCADCGDKD
ncbi:hypothetical protein ACFQUU_08885 [Herbaspirillum sp. GCM10030257]|uniref:hypothetical protein n=1 Tax=Herbaspirillum sp. GCM10030257 TaxID=3273393 RepID=UPI003622150A